MCSTVTVLHRFLTSRVVVLVLKPAPVYPISGEIAAVEEPIRVRFSISPVQDSLVVEDEALSWSHSYPEAQFWPAQHLGQLPERAVEGHHVCMG